MSQITLGEMIAKLRKENNMTQVQLAEKMNVTDKAVSKWERDLSCPDVDSLSRLGEIFTISVDELLSVKNQKKEVDKPKNKSQSIIDLILQGVGLAMGIAVTVLNIVADDLNMKSSMVMLGIGMSCFGIFLLRRDSRKDNEE